MIERDLIHLDVLVETHQAAIKRDWQSAHAGPGPVRQAIGRQLIHLGEVLGGKHAELQSQRQASGTQMDTALVPR